jgi:hypothetical protein
MRRSRQRQAEQTSESEPGCPLRAKPEFPTITRHGVFAAFSHLASALFCAGSTSLPRPGRCGWVPVPAACALAESGRSEEALDEFKAVSDYFAGAEARVRWAILLETTGRKAEATTIYTELLTQMRRAPKYVRKVQAEWIAVAEKQLRA